MTSNYEYISPNWTTTTGDTATIFCNAVKGATTFTMADLPV